MLQIPFLIYFWAHIIAIYFLTNSQAPKFIHILIWLPFVKITRNGTSSKFPNLASLMPTSRSSISSNSVTILGWSEMSTKYRWYWVCGIKLRFKVCFKTFNTKFPYNIINQKYNSISTKAPIVWVFSIVILFCWFRGFYSKCYPGAAVYGNLPFNI